MMSRLDFLILDNLGCLPFALSSIKLLLNLFREFYLRTSIIVNTNLAFSDAKMTVSELPRGFRRAIG